MKVNRNNYREHLKNFPVWSIVSFSQKSFTSEDEFILSVDGNGLVRKWSIDSKTCNTGNNKYNIILWNKLQYNYLRNLKSVSQPLLPKIRVELVMCKNY